MNRFLFVFLALPFVACSSSSNSAVIVNVGDGGVVDGGGTDAPPGGTQCSSARDQLLLPIDRVASGAVSIVSDTGGKKTIYVDASAGGLGSAAKNPRVYVDLSNGTRVPVTDKSAVTSTDWDLALKRAVIFSNSGDSGIGTGGAVQLKKPFASVSDADAQAATPTAESFFDADCNAKLDPTGAPATTFADWYDYDQTTNIPTPKPGVSYVVRGG